MLVLTLNKRCCSILRDDCLYMIDNNAVRSSGNFFVSIIGLVQPECSSWEWWRTPVVLRQGSLGCWMA